MLRTLNKLLQLLIIIRLKIKKNIKKKFFIIKNKQFIIFIEKIKYLKF